jgi:hypothetical protein
MRKWKHEKVRAHHQRWYQPVIFSCLLEIGSYCIVLVVLELKIHLPQPLECLVLSQESQSPGVCEAGLRRFKRRTVRVVGSALPSRAWHSLV